MNVQTNFGAIDWVIVGVYLLGSKQSEWLAGIASESALALITVCASWGAMIVLSLIFPDRPKPDSATSSAQDVAQ